MQHIHLIYYTEAEKVPVIVGFITGIKEAESFVHRMQPYTRGRYSIVEVQCLGG